MHALPQEQISPESGPGTGLTHILLGPSWTKTLNKASYFLGSDRLLITEATWARPQPHGQLSAVYVLETS